MRKLFLVTTFLVVVTVGVAACFYFFQKTDREETNLETYKNTVSHFQIHYPSDFKIYSYDQSSDQYTEISTSNNQSQELIIAKTSDVNTCIKDKSMCNNGLGYPISLHLDIQENTNDINKIGSLNEQYTDFVTGISIKKTIVAEQPAIQITQIEDDEIQRTQFFFNLNDKGFIATVMGPLNTQQLERFTTIIGSIESLK